MFSSVFGRGLAGCRQLVPQLARSSATAAGARAGGRPAASALSATARAATFARPLSSLGASQWCRHASTYVAKQSTVPAIESTGAAAKEACSKVATQEGIMKTANEAMVFEVGLSFVVLHYQSIFIGVMRCLFQSFRPLLILFVFGQILKAVFFIAGAPIWFSFYSIWLFEVGYGLAQCAISFIFISFFYNNLSFSRVRPALGQLFRQQKERFTRAAAALMA
eukprot:TRINITY_DN2285_c0_g2_i1.p2 TRINITY_DN2285_c0_g2~~TRINITY_DN2285_c0_g2_i1.p2  ORF type:complete len:222 (+),score=64.08 TRINITY_DN2285_c0_g2_i1:65-730(+)